MDDAIFELTRTDTRYAPEAYSFICESVAFTQETLGRIPHEDDDEDADYHITGSELARGVCELAVQEFGLMAWIVLKMWGLHATGDIGRIVFQLIEIGKLGQSESDEQADFEDLFDIREFVEDEFEFASVGVGKVGR